MGKVISAWVFVENILLLRKKKIKRLWQSVMSLMCQFSLCHLVRVLSTSHKYDILKTEVLGLITRGNSGEDFKVSLARLN